VELVREMTKKHRNAMPDVVQWTVYGWTGTLGESVTSHVEMALMIEYVTSWCLKNVEEFVMERTLKRKPVMLGAVQWIVHGMLGEHGMNVM
jgi:hypothetical protein